MAKNLVSLRHNGCNLSSIKSTIQDNLTPNRYYGNRILKQYSSFETIHKSKYLAKKAQLKDFGKFYSEAKKDGGKLQGQSVFEYLNRNEWIRRLRCWTDELYDNFSSCYYECNDCGHLGFDNDSMNVMDDYSVCNHCSQNYYWSDSNNYYQNEPDEDDEDDDYSNYENIGSYHSSKRHLGHIPSSFDNRTPRVLLGMELEMECDEDHDKDEEAGHLLDNLGKYNGYQYALCEEDGSLNDGFEMVTSYTGLDVHRHQLQFFKNSFAGMSSHNTKTCGLHVHICKSNMSTLHGAKMVFFINDSGNHSLIKAIARRDSASYAQLKDKKTDKSWLKNIVRHTKDKKNQLRGLNSDRYEALNFNNERTIEFRLFRGSLKYETIMACLEFTYATWHFCKDASIDKLTTSDFIQHICKPENKADTRFLRVYLKNKGFNMVCNMPTVCPEQFRIAA
jgi:hypothetical protein